MTSDDLLQQLRTLDRSSPEFHDRLSGILYGETYKRNVSRLQDNELVSLVDYLDKALDALDPASPAFRKCLRELRNICGTRTILPTSYILLPSLLNIAGQPVASGGFGDIYYEGTLSGLRVCVKHVRVYSKDGPKKATKTLYQEAVVWKRLTHPNIVPLLGITPQPLRLISEWMPGGDLTEYIKQSPGADRFSLLSDVANGLYCLHSFNIVHGDLKGPNILVDGAGHARITDFGLATVTQNLDSIRSASDDQGHTARWTAPEILSELGTYSKEADVFSFAMVMIEVFTGAVPFHNSLPAAAVLAIMKGVRPSRPGHPHFTDQLWVLMQRCWDQNPHSRPEVSEVLKVLRGSDPLPIKLTVYRTPSAPALAIDQQHSSPGHAHNVQHPPSPRHTLQTTPRKSACTNYSSGTSPPDSWSRSAGLEGGGNAGSCDRPHAMTWDSSLEQRGGQRGGRVRRRQPPRSTARSEPSPLPADPSPFNHDKPRWDQAYHDSVRCAGGSGLRLNLTNQGGTTVSRWPSKRDAPHPHENTGYRSGDPSERELRGGDKSRARLRTDFKTLNGDRESPDNREQEVGAALKTTLDYSNHPVWRRFTNHTLSAHECVSLITTIFSDRGKAEVVERLSGDDAQRFIDMIDESLDTLAPHIRRRCSRAVYRICGRQALLPRSLGIPLCYDPKDDPLCHGGFADVWKGQHRGQEVAAKVLRVFTRNDLGRTRRRFCREVAAWKTLRHPNVLPLLGVTISESRFVMVSEWMANGNINEFVKADAKANRLGLLEDVTRGLIYMHEQGIVHGDLKGANILINLSGRACLADFSLLTIVSDQSAVVSSWVEGGTIQWMSPELLNPERFGLGLKIRPTKESDCYALGMVIHEVLSGRTPFDQWKAPMVILKVLEGKRPERPQGEGGRLFTDAIWEALELCWKPQPSDRANARTILLCLGGTPSLSQPPSPMDGTAETDVDSQSDDTGSDSDPSNTPGGNGHLIALRTLPRCATVAVPCCAHCGNGCPVSPHGHPPGVKNPTISPEGSKLSAQPRQSCSEGWFGRLSRNARKTSKAITRKFCGVW